VQETHLAPPDTAAPMRQVAAAVIDAAHARSAEAPAAVPSRPAPVAQVPQVAAGEVKVLRLELEPGDLGAVSISMRLSGKSLELHVEVDRREALALIGKDRDVLSTSLQDQGYTLDTLTIRGVDAPPAPAPGTSPDHGSPTRGDAGAPPRQDTGARPQREREPGRHDGQREQRHTDHENNDPRHPRAPRRDLYL
jgi:chemotaxis protein MotD